MLVYCMYMHPEFWDSLETIAWLDNKVRLILLISGTVAAMATIVLYLVGNRKEVLVAEIISDLENTQRARKLSIDQQEDLVGLLAPYKGRTVHIAQLPITGLLALYTLAASLQ